MPQFEFEFWSIIATMFVLVMAGFLIPAIFNVPRTGGVVGSLVSQPATYDALATIETGAFGWFKEYGRDPHPVVTLSIETTTDHIPWSPNGNRPDWILAD